MKVCAVIAEYNPLHSGHSYHLEAARSQFGATHTVAVMSGNFVQRGDAAVCSKWARAEMALEGGADLVLELPLTFATATAQRFALGGVETVCALGGVDMLCFGSECGDIGLLREVAQRLNADEVTTELKRRLADGESFASARQSALAMFSEAAEVLSNPNDTLAVEYISALNLLGGSIEPKAVKRVGVAHDAGVSGGYASASYLRELIYSGAFDEAKAFMPKAAAEVLEREIALHRCPARLNKLDVATLACLRRMTVDEMAHLPDVSEGLENRLYKAVREAVSTESVIELTKSRRCTHARARRLVLHALLGITDELYALPVQYIRVLAMNDRGKEILANATPRVPIISRAKDLNALSDKARAVFECESRADDLYALTLDEPEKCGTNLTGRVIIK